MATNQATSASDVCRIVSAKRHRGAPLGTEEDGVDEAGSTTQSPFITAPQLRDSDPDVDGDGAIIDNSSMSSSRTRSGSSRSGSTGAGASRTQATPRADANGTTAKDDAKSEAAAEPDSEAAKPAAKPAKPAPMPADGIGRPSFTPLGRLAFGRRQQSRRPLRPTPSSPSLHPQLRHQLARATRSSRRPTRSRITRGRPGRARRMRRPRRDRRFGRLRLLRRDQRHPERVGGPAASRPPRPGRRPG